VAELLVGNTKNVVVGFIHFIEEPLCKKRKYQSSCWNKIV